MMEQEKKISSRPAESSFITNWLSKRIKRGLGANILSIGSPGTGKSYSCMRLAENFYREYHGEELKETNFVVDRTVDIFRFVRNVKRPGEPLVIEELSVLAGARRSMSRSNVAITQLLDIVRKKQIILMMNAPTLESVDKHALRLSHMLIESLRINKSKGFSVLKPLLLQLGSQGKVYRHYMRVGGRRTQRAVLYKPNDDLCKNYEKKKDEFQNRTYEHHEMQAMAEERKKNKEAGVVSKMPEAIALTDRQREYLTDYHRLGTLQKVADKHGKDVTTIHKSLQAVKKKLAGEDILQKMPEIPGIS